MEYKILFLDDDELAHKSFKNNIDKVLPDINKSIDCFQRSQDALEVVKNRSYDIFFLDQQLTQGILGSDVAKKIKEIQADAYIVMATAYGLDSAEEAIRSKAFADFISKTQSHEFIGLAQVFGRLNFYNEERKKRIEAEKRAEDAEKREKQNASIIAELQDDFNIDISTFTDDTSRLKGNSEAMKQVRWFIDLYSQVDLPVLILGETGTGKELVAEEIKLKSKRAKGPFEIRNCSAIPETMIESELFGAMPGSYTDIRERHYGAFELADKGVLFLDEFGEMSPNVQVKVLRAIETHKIRPLGAKKEIPVDVRVICATNKKLNEIVRNNEFRKDLFYRVVGLFPEMPSLKDRKEDIREIYFNYIMLNNKDHCFTPEAIKELIINKYEWPGNVRELLKFFEHTSAIFPNTKFDRTKTLKLLDLWQTHQPVEGLLNSYVKPSGIEKPKELEIELKPYEVKDIVDFLTRFLTAYQDYENKYSKAPTIHQIEKILEPTNKKGWLSQRFSKDQIDKKKIFYVIDNNPKLSRLKNIPPIKKFYK